MGNDRRSEIARKVKALRVKRGWTQAELSRRLALSQSRLSEIEQGQGSFSAEQFLEILKLFNVTIDHFAHRTSTSAEIQKALARLGAGHLQEDPDQLPSGRIEAVEDVVIEVLAGSNPRQISSLAPVLVHNIDYLQPHHLLARCIEVAMEARFRWLVENILHALRAELADKPARKWLLQYQRADLKLGALVSQWQRKGGESLDLWDSDIRSRQSLDEVRKASSPLSKKWQIVTALQPEDFQEALRASRAVD